MTHQPSLLSRQGRELLDRLAAEHVDPDRALRLAESLRGSYPPDLVAAALTQQALRTAASAKFSRAARMLFTRPGLEQASSERTARHSAARFAAARLVADLCCGIGGNLTALATATAAHSAGPAVLGVDRDLTALEFARHNAAVYGAAGHLAVVCADVRELPLARMVDGVFIDPARRAGGARLRGGRSDPPLDWCLQLAATVPSVCVKAAPGIDRALVPAGWEIEFLAVGRSLKEALLWSPALATTGRRATVLPSDTGLPRDTVFPLDAGLARDAGLPGSGAGAAAGGTVPVAGDAQPVAGDALRPAGDTLITAAGPPVPVAAPGAFLLDPNPAVTRAGLVQELGRQLGAWQIDPMIAFLSADRPLPTPFGRLLRVLESAPWHEKDFARRLRALGVGFADIRRRGLAGDVEQIRRRLGLQGDASAVIVITRVNDRPWGLICTAADNGNPR